MTAGTKSKYGASPVWACSRCTAQSAPVRSRRKGARDCPICKSPAAVRCFASKAEFKWLRDLRALERIGAVRNLEVQPVYSLIINGKYCGKYTADFRYWNDNDMRVLEVKGFETREGALRRKIAEALYGMQVEVCR